MRILIVQVIGVIAVLLTFVFMFRFEMSDAVAISSDDTPGYKFSARVYRLDRWTGEIDVCSVGCYGVDAINNHQ